MPGEIVLGLAFGIGVSPAPPDVMEALTEANVHIGSGGPNGFDLKFAAGTESPLVTDRLPGGYFDPGTRVVLTVTHAGQLHVLMDGVITQQEMAPSNDAGKSVLSIKGDDLTRMMDVLDLTGLPYPAMPVELRVALIVAKYTALYGMIPLIIPAVIMDISTPLERTPVQQGTDLDYVKALADNAGYTFYLQPGPQPGSSIAYWGPVLRAPIPFLPTPPPIAVDADSRSNVESLQFAFDGFGATQWVVLIQDPDLAIPIPIPVPNINPISPPLATKMPAPLKIRQMTGLPSNPLAAAAAALGRAAAGANSVTASGSLDVVRYGAVLDARTLVEVRGAGITFDGTYFVESVTHALKRGSYKQNFTLSRNSLVAAPPAMAPALPGLAPPGEPATAQPFATASSLPAGSSVSTPGGADLASQQPVGASGQPALAGRPAGVPASPRPVPRS